MRQILFHIPLDRGIPLGSWGELPVFGFGLLLVLWALFGLWIVVDRVRQKEVPWSSDDFWTVVRWGVVASLIIAAPRVGAYLRLHGSPPFRDGFPLFGYGVMLVIGIGSGVVWSVWRANREHLSGDKIWDLAFCLFVAGIAGARLLYVVEYPDRVFKDTTTLPEFVYALFNLSSGGIVLYGGLIAAAVAFFVFCAVNRLRPLALVDIITPSIFLGIGFGRIGCFLNGCCYGDETTLPWGVQFPRGSATFSALVEKGLLNENALCTPPLHPTQIYSSIDGFFLAALTGWYFSRRRRNGEVFAIGLTIYPITRFLIEFIRGDEPGILQTRFTISQWISALMFLIAIGYLIWLSRRPLIRDPICTEPAASSGAGGPVSSSVVRPQAAR